MRLLTLNDREEPALTSFPDEHETPCYAILSHTWGPDEEEVNFQDVENGRGKTKVGFEKIRFCSNQARKDGLQYIWVDTCCIDKSNSSELQEAITSMYRWYQCASRCYVYLADVSAEIAETGDRFRPWVQTFRTSRWFTRGWTLQELLAPKSVIFFSQEGKLLGDKKTMEKDVLEITGIPTEALRGAPLTDFSIDQRLKWAESRKTRRREDRAYCLLGIFNVFMPLIYGEGDNAFTRLKAEIDAKTKINAIPRNSQPQSSPLPRPFPGSPYSGLYSQYSVPSFTNPWEHQSLPAEPRQLHAPPYGQSFHSAQELSHTSTSPSMSYAQYLALQQQQQQQLPSPSSADALDLYGGMLPFSASALADVTPRNAYGREAPEPRSQTWMDMSDPRPLRRSPSISSINSVHSEISEHDGQGNVTKRTVTTTTTTYYRSSYSSASDIDADYSSAAFSESETPDRMTISRPLPRPAGQRGEVPPFPRSVMGQFASKLSSNAQKKHKCKICDKRFTRPSSLQTHMYSHTGEKPFACDVQGCGRVFSVVSNLRRHKRVHRSEPMDTDREGDD